MVKKFKVSASKETDDQGFTHAPHETLRQYAEGADGFLIGVPIDALITEIKPAFEEGWYLLGAGTDSVVTFWSADELVDVDPDFLTLRTRVNPPELYKKED